MAPISPRESLAIHRKAGKPIEELDAEGTIAAWRRRLRDFHGALTARAFGALVFDYDGTLCDRRVHPGIEPDIVAHLHRLVEAGLRIGIATGRGGSVRKELRPQIAAPHWQSVTIGYYSASDIGNLGDDRHPDATPHVCDELQHAAAALRRDAGLAALAEFKFRRWQIAVRPRSGSSAADLWQTVQGLVERCGAPGVSVWNSGYTVDVLAPGVSKTNLVERLREDLAPGASEVLCIGDKGLWPGNDFALLQQPFSLSVDEADRGFRGAWNLLPPECAGPRGTAWYLSRLSSPAPGAAQLQPIL